MWRTSHVAKSVVTSQQINNVMMTSSQQLSRGVSTTGVLHHTPGQKMASKGAKQNPQMTQKQQRKMELLKEKQREKWMEKLKDLGIKIPPDPDLVVAPELNEASRRRNVSAPTMDVVEERALLEKEWSAYQMRLHVEDLKMVRVKREAREVALRELKIEADLLHAAMLKDVSETTRPTQLPSALEEVERKGKVMYPGAVDVTTQGFPFLLKGPMDTPPDDDYEPPDYAD